MKKPTRFEIMRRNRRAAEERAIREELDSDLYWDTHRHDYVLARNFAGQDTGQWLKETREEARRATLKPRRWWQFWGPCKPLFA